MVHVRSRQQMHACRMCDLVYATGTLIQYVHASSGSSAASVPPATSIFRCLHVPPSTTVRDISSEPAQHSLPI